MVRLIVLILCGNLFSQLDPNFISQTDAKINEVRTGKAVLNLTRNGEALSDVSFKIQQIKHHFGFGAAIGYDFLVNTPGYAESFLKFFEWAVFENDMKWPSTDPTPNGPDYSKPDSLIDFCLKNDIKVRGHNLFWNQMEDWFPTWTMELGTEDFKAAVDSRIQNAMSHFKGKVEHWDIVNEIIHGSVLQDHSQDPNIIDYIFKEARAIDPDAKLTVNDFNILVWNSTQDYTNNVTNMLNNNVPIDIVGCEGHFGDELSQDYAGKLDQVASLNLPIWITELDFSTSGNPADEFEKLMRTFYSHPMVEGVVMWAWWEGNKWREELNSTVANEDFSNTPLGDRYLELMEKWTSQDSSQTNEEGKYSFTGHHGKYEITVFEEDTAYVDTFYLEPGESEATWAMELPEPVLDVSFANPSKISSHIYINGMAVLTEFINNKPIDLEIYSTSGKLIWSQKLYPGKQKVTIDNLSLGCFLYKIKDSQGAFSWGKGYQL